MKVYAQFKLTALLIVIQTTRVQDMFSFYVAKLFFRYPIAVRL